MKLLSKVALPILAAAVDVSGQGDATYSGPGTVYCGEGSTDDSIGGTCWVQTSEESCDYSSMLELGQPLMGSPSPSVGNIKDFFYIPEGCTLSCNQCSFESTSDAGCSDDEKDCPTTQECIQEGATCPDCVADGGYEWCPATNTCVRSWETGTPVECGGSGGRDPPVGTSYCTYSPDYRCYENGWPKCCGDDSEECPQEQPSCEPMTFTGPGTVYCGDGVNAGTCTLEGDNVQNCDEDAFNAVGMPMMGTPSNERVYGGIEYFVHIGGGCSVTCTGCTYESDADNGCTTDGGFSYCPTEQQCIQVPATCPACVSDGGYTWCPDNNECVRAWESSTPENCKGGAENIELPGSSYCTYAPDYDCYASGWPPCCGSENVTCPEEPAACEGGPAPAPTEEMLGEDFCTYAPDTDCYESGWPSCCSDDSEECPEEAPACDLKEGPEVPPPTPPPSEEDPEVPPPTAPPSSANSLKVAVMQAFAVTFVSFIVSVIA